MYSAVLIVVTGVACARGSWVVWGLGAVLALFFEVKTRREERSLMKAYDGYEAYAAVTGKFLPGIARLRPRTWS